MITPGGWHHTACAHAKQFPSFWLGAAGWRAGGALLDSHGEPYQELLTPSSSSARRRGQADYPQCSLQGSRWQESTHCTLQTLTRGCLLPSLPITHCSPQALTWPAYCRSVPTAVRKLSLVIALSQAAEEDEAVDAADLIEPSFVQESKALLHTL